jgi:hypothetical protein
VFRLTCIIQARVGVVGAKISDAPLSAFRSRREPWSWTGAPASGLVRRWAAAAILTGGVALAGVAGSAMAQSYSPGALSADQSAQVVQICKTVIRVQPEEEHYEGCVDSLSASLSNVGQARALRRARDGCLDKGLAPASPELAECLLDDDAPRSGSTAAASSRSYVYASDDELHHREQLSCARLGFEPASGAFASCVADLAATLFAADMPQN